MIKEFYIFGLYGERNIRIPFNDPYKIIVAENGYGKTTILSAFYAVFSGDINKLRKIDFSRIGIVFTNGEEIFFEKEEFELSDAVDSETPFLRVVKRKFGSDFLIKLLQETRDISNAEIRHSDAFKQASSVLSLPSGVLRREIIMARELFPLLADGTSLKEKFERIKEISGLEGLYLPTYRRVEEDVREYNELSNKGIGAGVINFGMSDVKESIDKITKEILASSVEWFSKINGEMLSQLVNGFSVTDDMKAYISRPKAVEIVLERIGKNIAQPHKEQILKLVSSGEILNGHDPLIYFVGNLLKVYEQQQENDIAIQDFTKVSNKYLVDKEIVYDESSVTIEIRRKKNGRIVDLENLSSGEKQIISLFALLYLGKKENLAIFFDEPELSLSIEWQKSLLPDIVESNKCKFLFSTTHSPFVFENYLQEYTVDLSEYIEEF